MQTTKKKREKLNKIRHERGDVTTDTIEVIKKNYKLL